jgi:hypothetical protein
MGTCNGAGWSVDRLGIGTRIGAQIIPGSSFFSPSFWHFFSFLSLSFAFSFHLSFPIDFHLSYWNQCTLKKYEANEAIRLPLKDHGAVVVKDWEGKDGE